MHTGKKVKTKEYPVRVPERVAIPAPDVFTKEKTKKPQEVEVEIVNPTAPATRTGT